MKKIIKFILTAFVILFILNAVLVYFIPIDYIMPGNSGDISDKYVNILLMGTDESGLRTDSMMIASIDFNEGTVLVISVPRDIKVTYPKTAANKLNAVYGIANKSPDDTIKFIEGFTGLSINYYVIMEPKGFRELVDSVGGVEFSVPVDMKYSDPAQNLYIDLKAGMQHLDGDKAEQLTRFRGYPNADLERISVQRELFKALLEQKVNPVNILRAGEIFLRFKKSVNTNIDFLDIPAVLKLLQLTGKGSITEIEVVTKPQTINGSYYLICDTQITKELIRNK